jgi:hypothetical protein
MGETDTFLYSEIAFLEEESRLQRTSEHSYYVNKWEWSKDKSFPMYVLRHTYRVPLCPLVRWPTDLMDRSSSSDIGSLSAG